MRKGDLIHIEKDEGLLPQIKGMIFLSSIGHIILFILVIYLSLRFHQYRPKTAVYNVNLVDFIGEKPVPKPSGKTNQKEAVKNVSPPPVVKEKPKEVKKTEPKNPEPPKKEAKKIEKPRVTEVERNKPKESKKGSESTKTPHQPTTSNNTSSVASQRNDVSLAGNYRGSLSLDNANFPFTYYLILIRDKISENWDPNFVSQPFGVGEQVVISFKIQKDGNISDPYIEKTSGVPYLDQSALRAVISSVPFPPLPREFTDYYLGIHFGFEYIKEG
jgi:TonB family protein